MKVLSYFRVLIPRTWDEYTEVAEYFHGMEVPAIDGNGTQVISGSCMPKANYCSWMYGLNLMIHASTVQTNGTSTGILFDPKTSKPLLGKAFAETLRHTENLAKVGHPDGKFGKWEHVGSSGSYVDTYDEYLPIDYCYDLLSRRLVAPDSNRISFVSNCIELL